MAKSILSGKRRKKQAATVPDDEKLLALFEDSRKKKAQVAQIPTDATAFQPPGQPTQIAQGPVDPQSFNESTPGSANPSSENSPLLTGAGYIDGQTPTAQNNVGEPVVPKEDPSLLTGAGYIDGQTPGQPEKNGSFLGRANSTVGRVNQGFYGLPADIAEGIAIGGSAIERGLGINPDAKTEDNPLYKAAQWYRGKIAEIAPNDPQYQDEIQDQVGQAVGQLAGLVLTGGASQAAKAPTLMSEAVATGKPIVKAATEVFKGMASPSGAVGAAQMGVSEFKQAIQSGESEEVAFEQFLKNAAVGSVLERMPVQLFFRRLNTTTNGGVANMLKKGFSGGTEEMTTEVIQQLYANQSANQTYEKTTRDLLDGVAEGGGIGFGLGFLLNAMGVSLRKQKANATPEQKAQIEAAEEVLKGEKQKFEQTNRPPGDPTTDDPARNNTQTQSEESVVEEVSTDDGSQVDETREESQTQEVDEQPTPTDPDQPTESRGDERPGDQLVDESPEPDAEQNSNNQKTEKVDEERATPENDSETRPGDEQEVSESVSAASTPEQAITEAYQNYSSNPEATLDEAISQLEQHSYTRDELLNNPETAQKAIQEVFGGPTNNQIQQNIRNLAQPKEGVSKEEQAFTSLSDEELEVEFNKAQEENRSTREIEKELDQREWDSLVNQPLDKALENTRKLINKNKKSERGEGISSSYENASLRDLEQTLEAFSEGNVSDGTLKQNLRTTVTGFRDNYAPDAITLRETLKEMANRGYSLDEIKKISSEQLKKDGFSNEDANRFVDFKLTSIFKDAQSKTVSPKQIADGKSARENSSDSDRPESSRSTDAQTDKPGVVSDGKNNGKPTKLSEEDQAKQKINNTIDLAQEWNNLTKTKRNSEAGRRQKQQIKKRARDLGYKVETNRANVMTLIDPKTGAEARKKRIKEDTSQFKTLEEVDSKVKETYSLLKKSGGLDTIGANESRINIDMKPRDFEKAKRDIEAGVKSRQADDLLNWVAEVNKNGFVPMATKAVSLEDVRQMQKDAEKEFKLESPEDSIEAPFYKGKVFADPNLMGSPSKRTKTLAQRVQPDPISTVNVKPKKNREIVLNLSKGLGASLRYSKNPGRRALGSYNPRNAAVLIRGVNDMDTIAHEIGHALDNRFKLLPNMPLQAANELDPFAKTGSKPPKNHPNPTQYKLGEGVAEWFRAYVVNPEEAKRRAPEFYQHYQNQVPKNARDKVANFSMDLRVLIGSGGHQQAMANVEMDYQSQKDSWLSYLKPTTKEPSTFNLSLKDRLATQWTDSMRPFQQAVAFAKEQKGIKNLDPSKNPTMLARLTLGMNEKFDNILKKGLVDSQMKRLSDTNGDAMNLNWLFAPLDATNETTLKGEMEQVVSFMVAERTVELKDRFGSNTLSGIGAGIFKDIDVAKKRLDEFAALPVEKKKRIKKAAGRYRKYADHVLQYMVDKGRLSKEQYQKIKKDNLYYVSLQRVMEASPDEEIQVFSQGSGKIGTPSEVLTKIKGSSRSIKNPYASLLDTAYKAIKESDRNEVMQSFRELILTSQDMYQGDVTNLAQIGVQATAADPNTIKVFVDGKPQYWQFQEDVYASLKGLSSAGHTLPGWFTALPKLLRFTVTNFPAFAIRNRIRDFQNRLIISNNNPESGLDIYTSKTKKAEAKNLYQLFGGGQAGYYLMNDNFYQQQMDFALKELAGSNKHILASPSKMWDSYSRLISSSETAGRLEEYRSAFKKAKKKGMSEYDASVYAAFESRDLLDFAVAGETMRVINQAIPFANAAVQGIRRSVRSAIENPAGFAARVALYSFAPALLNRMLLQLWDREEEFQQLPAYQRDLFYNIPLGPELWLTIPRPYELAVIGSMGERLVDRLYFGNEKAFDGHAGSVARSVLPVDESAIAGPFRAPIELLVNYDFFRQTHIIPPWEINKDVKLRNTDRGSRLGKAVQNAVGVDARQVDHAILSTTAYFGRFGLAASNIGRDDAKQRMDWTQTGVLKDYPLWSSVDVQWLQGKAKKFDLLRDPMYREMNDLLGDYFNAETDEERSKRAKVVREYAGKLRSVWDELELYREDKKEKARFKKESRKKMSKLP